MKNWTAPLVFLVLVVVAILAIIFLSGKATNDESKFHIVTTFYPLAFAAQELGGDNVKVTNLTAGGIEPHEFEPTPGDIIKMQAADLLIVLGELDVWANDAVEARRTQGKATIVVRESIPMVIDDPHVWLDPILFQDIARLIAEELNFQADEILSNLAHLDLQYQELKTCERNDIIVAHDAFGYLAHRYDFVAHAVSGITPGDEPSARDLVRLTDLARDLEVQTIFFEETASPDLAQTIADEVGAKTDVMFTLESLSDEQMSEDYYSLMGRNFDKLKAELCR